MQSVWVISPRHIFESTVLIIGIKISVIFTNLIIKYMYAFENKMFPAYRAIAMLVAVALVLWAVGYNIAPGQAEAANVTSFSDTLSDSAPNSPSNHTLIFTTPNGLLIGETIEYTFPAGFNLQNLDFNDMDLRDDGADQTLAAAAGAGTWGVSTTTTTITLETPTDTGVGSSSIIALFIGTHASSGATGDTQILNPSATSSYEIDVAGTMTDSGHTRVAIVENVAVTAQVNTQFTFTVSGTTTGVTVNGSPTTTASDTTPTSLPFGTLSAGTSVVLGQDLTVETNAVDGFVVTVYQDQNLQSSTGADIDGFVDGNYTDTPAAWISPSNSITNENTWGHWGLTSSDADLVGQGTDFGSDEWVAASTTPRVVFAHDDPADAQTFGVGYAHVGYQVQITSLQEAGDDYSTTLTYVATPTF